MPLNVQVINTIRYVVKNVNHNYMDELEKMFEELSEDFTHYSYSFFETNLMDLGTIEEGAKVAIPPYGSIFDIDGEKVLWVNPFKLTAETSGHNGQMMFMFTNDTDEDNAVERANRVFSLISYALSPIRSLQTTLVVKSGHVGFKSPYPFRYPSPLVVPVQRELDKYDFDQLDVSDRYALAYSRQAQTTSSDYFEYLCYWHILEVYSNRVSQVMFDNIDNMGPNAENFVKWDPLARQESISKSLNDTRNECAHLLTMSGNIKDPDDPKLYKRVKNDKILLKSIVYELMSARPGLVGLSR
jgi:hypothetical protein